jgi:hypothetical protein
VVGNRAAQRSSDLPIDDRADTPPADCNGNGRVEVVKQS